jgi:predicted neuraminidase
MSPGRRDVLKAIAATPLFGVPAEPAARSAAPVTSGFIYENAPFPQCHASTIVESEPGRLLAAWFGGTKERASDVCIWLARFESGGWSPIVKVAEEPGIPTWNPVLHRLRDGEVLLFYKAGPSPETWSSYLKRSRDGGRSWADAEIMPAGLLGPIKNKPIDGKDGEIIAGSSVESYNAWTSWVEISRDGARSWSKHGPIAVPGVAKGVIQPALFWTRRGTLRMVMRATQRIGFVCLAESADGGRTWGPARPTRLPNPNAGVDAVRLADGRVLIVYNHTREGRSPLNVAVSADDGDTWEMKATLESEPGEYSYPAVIQAANGDVHVTYTWKRQRIKHVVLKPGAL